GQLALAQDPGQQPQVEEHERVVGHLGQGLAQELAAGLQLRAPGRVGLGVEPARDRAQQGVHVVVPAGRVGPVGAGHRARVQAG
ncbi:hypothetical protein DF186_20590, partial [Enterococcus hirae]